jgi:hypothetical protein
MKITKQLLADLGTDRAGFEEMKSIVEDFSARSDRGVEQAILRIYNRQTSQETSASTTLEDNGIGFASCDARTGSYLAKLVANGYWLYPKSLEKARKLAFKYRTQLTVLALEKKKNKG